MNRYTQFEREMVIPDELKFDIEHYLLRTFKDWTGNDAGYRSVAVVLAQDSACDVPNCAGSHGLQIGNTTWIYRLECNEWEKLFIEGRAN